mmetsp:Transcript_14669/g.19245  ORF Transcript_14669/g.19245 Transcript_14669/m.19245 type:complete len:411 (-) Transcript_14669:693-1925(-)
MTASALREPPSRVICIGDIHGNIQELTSLYENLISEIGQPEVDAATFCFLGDYCDRGPDTKAVLDWLIDFRNDRAQDSAKGEAHFICGNHDFAMAAYLGALPKESTEDFDLDSTIPSQFPDGYWQHDVPNGMHFQGRRWGGAHIYQSRQTFESYGVKFSSHKKETREQLLNAVPSSHKEFLSSLEWVADFDVSFQPGRMVCVHAGLQQTDVEKQLKGLKSKKLNEAALFEKGNPGRLAPFSGRKTVKKMPTELKGKCLLVSGHHGHNQIEKERIIFDQSGGMPTKRRPLQALVFPERKIISCSYFMNKSAAALRREQLDEQLYQWSKAQSSVDSDEKKEIVRQAIMENVPSHRPAWEMVLVSRISEFAYEKDNFLPSSDDIVESLSALASEGVLTLTTDRNDRNLYQLAG